MNFLRYPGGKKKLTPYLSKYLPERNQIKGKYIEPFVGGGSIFFHFNPEHAILSDLCKELTDIYKAIRNYPHNVWKIFSSFPSGKKAYYQLRDENQKNKPICYRAARTLYLNRTCFKGMWRHNPQGKFNVGYGGEERRNVLTHQILIQISARLRKANIINTDFEKTLDLSSDGDFIFLDPPYKPGEKEMNHSHYINGRFSFEDQKRLANQLNTVSKTKKVKWMMTNSSHPAVRNLYKNFKIRKIPKGTSKIVGVLSDNSKEILISNY